MTANLSGDLISPGGTTFGTRHITETLGLLRYSCCLPTKLKQSKPQDYCGPILVSICLMVKHASSLFMKGKENGDIQEGHQPGKGNRTTPEVVCLSIHPTLGLNEEDLQADKVLVRERLTVETMNSSYNSQLF